MELVVNIESVELGNTENHLLFKGYVPSHNNFCKYKFDYTSTDLTSTSGLSDKHLNKLRKQLQKDYGYPPFDEVDAKNKLGKGKRYEIKV